MGQEIVIYHNPRCSKSRLAIEFLKDKNLNYSIIDYLKNSPSKKELISILKKLNIRPLELIRTNEAVYKLHYKNRQLTDNEWLDAMLENPQLIERPIVILGNHAVVARPIEKIVKLLELSIDDQ